MKIDSLIIFIIAWFIGLTLLYQFYKGWKIDKYPVRESVYRKLTDKEKQVLIALSNNPIEHFLQHTWFLEDSRNDVWRVEGKIYMGIFDLGLKPTLHKLFLGKGYKFPRIRKTTELDSNFDYRIGGYKFHNYAAEPFIKEVVDVLKAGDIVAVEFSPKTHYVWKIEKLNTTPVAHSSENKV